MRLQYTLLAIVLALNACAERDAQRGPKAPTNTSPNEAASGAAAINPTLPDESRRIPPSATPPTLPDNPDDEVMPPGPVNPR